MRATMQTVARAVLGFCALPMATTQSWASEPAQTCQAARPVPHISEEIAFENAGVVLRGTVYRPRRPVGAVVLVHGSGQEARMSDFAARFAGSGIAVLTYDKRGVGKSGGTYAGPEVGTNNVDPQNLALLGDDANAAVRALAGRLAPSRTPVGLLGFSQAGWVIPLAAEQNRAVGFMVLFSGPLITTLEQLRFQFYTNGDPKFWDTHDEAQARKHVRDDPDRFPFVATDPRTALSRVSVPGLWLYGARDVQVPARLSIERLGELRATGKRFEHRLFPSLGHNTAFAEDAEPVCTAVAWIKARAKR